MGMLLDLIGGFHIYRQPLFDERTEVKQSFINKCKQESQKSFCSRSCVRVVTFLTPRTDAYYVLGRLSRYPISCYGKNLRLFIG